MEVAIINQRLSKGIPARRARGEQGLKHTSRGRGHVVVSGVEVVHQIVGLVEPVIIPSPDHAENHDVDLFNAEGLVVLPKNIVTITKIHCASGLEIRLCCVQKTHQHIIPNILRHFNHVKVQGLDTKIIEDSLICCHSLTPQIVAGDILDNINKFVAIKRTVLNKGICSTYYDITHSRRIRLQRGAQL
nr:MAG TPA: hypothetical protein [Caudoviricetes sp.]